MPHQEVAIRRLLQSTKRQIETIDKTLNSILFWCDYVPKPAPVGWAKIRMKPIRRKPKLLIRDTP